MDIAGAIKVLAQERGYSLSTLAEKMGVNRKTLYSAINGNPRLSNLQRIADALGFRLSDIIAIAEDVEDMCNQGAANEQANR